MLYSRTSSHFVVWYYWSFVQEEEYLTPTGRLDRAPPPSCHLSQSFNKTSHLVLFCLIFVGKHQNCQQ